MEAASSPLPPSSIDLIRASEAASRDEKSVFGDILGTISDKDWLDGLVDQPQRKEKSSRGSVPPASGLEEFQHASFNFDDRQIGTIIVAVEKRKKKVEKDKGTKPSKAVEEDVGEDVAPLRRKTEKKKKDAGTYKSSEVKIVALPVERLSVQVAEKTKNVKESLCRLREDAHSLISAKKLGREMREKEIEQGGLEARQEEEDC